MDSQNSITLDELDYITNLQRQEAFDETATTSSNNHSRSGLSKNNGSSRRSIGSASGGGSRNKLLDTSVRSPRGRKRSSRASFARELGPEEEVKQILNSKGADVVRRRRSDVELSSNHNRGRHRSKSREDKIHSRRKSTSDAGSTDQLKGFKKRDQQRSRSSSRKRTSRSSTMSTGSRNSITSGERSVGGDTGRRPSLSQKKRSSRSSGSSVIGDTSPKSTKGNDKRNVVSRSHSDQPKQKGNEFDKLWENSEKGDKPKRPLGDFLKKVSSTSDISGKKISRDSKSVGYKSVVSSRRSSGRSVAATHVPGERPRMTKLEKIQELQSKYEKYKKEWIDTTRDKNKFKKELRDSKLSIISLTKEIDVYMTETTTLRKNLSESLQRVDQLTEEQRAAHMEHANTAKDLAQARIDLTKSLNDARELRVKVDSKEASLVEKDKRIEALTKAVDDQIFRVDELEKDLTQADEEIIKLEEELKEMQDELIEYRTAAAKGDDAELKHVRDEMEQKVNKERERRLEEKQRKLDEKLREFEEERRRQHELDKKKEEEDAQRLAQEYEKHRQKEEERQKLDSEINQKLKELEDDNAVLQGRLKSEQLDSNVKLQKKDDVIASLQKDFMSIKQELKDRDADPEGANALKAEIEKLHGQKESLVLDLEDAQKQNGMMQEEIEDLHVIQGELKAEIKELTAEASEAKKQSLESKQKADELKHKVGEWTEKAFEWKGKAEEWEKIVKELDQKGDDGNAKPAEEAAPQAMFLEAAIAKKKATAPAQGGGWGRLGGIFGGADSNDEEDPAARVKELEEINAAQLETIKSLRSEMVKMQAQHKEEAYRAQKQLREIEDENEAILRKNVNLMKELEMARTLNEAATKDP